MLTQYDMNLISREKKETKDSETQRIKSLILNNGYLTRHDKYGHGYFIPDELWVKLFPKKEV